MSRYRYRPTKTLAQRLDGKYRQDESGCWLWTGTLLAQNLPTRDYGAVYVSATPSRKMAAHRASWLVFRGEIPRGLCVLHHCDTPRCINPDHLFLGTRGENNKDRARKGRSKTMRGSSNNRATITENIAREIKRRLIPGVPRQPRGVCKRIADDIGVSLAVVHLD